MLTTLPSIKTNIETSKKAEGQTILHCYLKCVGPIRVWRSTFLIDNNGYKYKLIIVDGITLYPNWTYHDYFTYSSKCFTLIFEKLNANCVSFNLEEQIPQPSGFYSNKLSKNNSGVYSTEIFT